MARSCIIIDLSNLNVLFKRDDKFVMALNFNHSVERLCEMATSLDSSYDVYLCLKPRVYGEGDFVVDELSLSSIPFESNKEELEKVLKLVRDMRGVGEVFVSNWLSNYIVAARVPSFRSVFFYGDRVAMLVVKDRQVENFEVLKDVREYDEKYGGKHECYGDVGLLDCEGLSAQYPELSGATKLQLTMLAPLVTAYRNPMRISMDDLLDRINGVEKRVKVAPPQEEEPESENTVSVFTPPPPVVDEEEEAYEAYNLKRRKPAFSGFGKIAAVFACVAALALGASANVVVQHKIAERPQSYYDTINERVVKLQSVQKVYETGGTKVFQTANTLNFVNSSDIGITVIGFEAYPDNYVVRCTCASENGQSLLAEYIETQYTVLSTNDLGYYANGDAQEYHFSITFS